MKKQELISTIAKDMKTTKKETAKFLKSFMQTIGKVLSKKDKTEFVDIARFCKINVSKKVAHVVRHPETREIVNVKEKVYPKVKFSKTFVNQWF